MARPPTTVRESPTAAGTPPEPAADGAAPAGSYASRPLAALLGSLELAIALLAVWAAALLLGTLVESWYDAAAAGELVYGAWWFRLLLALLAVNILCAALKKWPWKRHQLGFLITHLGLLTLLAAAAWSALASSSGTMTLCDSPAADGLPEGWHTSNLVIDPSRHVLRIEPEAPGDSNSPEDEERVQIVPFAPGVLGWNRGGATYPPPHDAAATWLQALARPWPADWSWSLDDGARLAILAYYPCAEVHSSFVAAAETGGFPAVEVELSSPVAGTLPALWVAGLDEHDLHRRGPAIVHLLPSLQSPAELAAFLAPQAKPGFAGSARGLLQFAVDRQHRLHYRAFHRPAASPAADVAHLPWQFESAGPIAAGEPPRKLWSAMGWQLRVTRFLPRARRLVDVVRVDQPLGVRDAAHPAAVLCQLERAGARTECWVPRTDEGATTVALGGRSYRIGFHPRWFELDFALTLGGAEQRFDPGTGRLAEQASRVLLDDPAGGLRGEPHTIALNAPLEYRGYKFYQAALQNLGRGDDGGPITQVQLTVGYDPASYLKYAGAAIVSLGIACMFYMRAYPLTTIELWSAPDVPSATTAEPSSAAGGAST